MTTRDAYPSASTYCPTPATCEWFPHCEHDEDVSVRCPARGCHHGRIVALVGGVEGGRDVGACDICGGDGYIDRDRAEALRGEPGIDDDVIDEELAEIAKVDA